MFQVAVDITDPLEGLSEKQKGFLRQVFDCTRPGDNDLERRWEAPYGIVMITLNARIGFHPAETPKADEIILEDFKAETMGKGDGKAALAMLFEAADANGIAIGLNASPHTECLMSEYALVEWYKGQGFEKYRGPNNPMWREPA